MTRLTLILLATLAAPGVALAQTAETTVPDTEPSPEWTVTPADPAPDVAAVWLDPDQRIEAVEETLREIIASAQAGDFTHPDMSENLAKSIEGQKATLLPVVQGFGALQSVEHQGLENGAERFRVDFETAETEWIIGFNDDGKIGLLLFRPATPPVPEAPSAPEAPEAPAETQ